MKLYKTKDKSGNIWITKDKAGLIPHCATAPAYIKANSSLKTWWLNGKRHRIGGPAIEDGQSVSYWIDGKYYSDYSLYEKDALIFKKFNKNDIGDVINILNV